MTGNRAWFEEYQGPHTSFSCNCTKFTCGFGGNLLFVSLQKGQDIQVRGGIRAANPLIFFCLQHRMVMAEKLTRIGTGLVVSGRKAEGCRGKAANAGRTESLNP